MRRYREWRREIAAMITITGLLLTIIAVLHYALPEKCSVPPGFACDLVQNKIGQWNVWTVVVGPILLLAGVFYLGDTIRKYREFDRLMDTDSKAKFVQNQDRIEYLAWLLSARLEKRVEEKKREFRID